MKLQGWAQDPRKHLESRQDCLTTTPRHSHPALPSLLLLANLRAALSLRTPLQWSLPDPPHSGHYLLLCHGSQPCPSLPALLLLSLNFSLTVRLNFPIPCAKTVQVK
jgi:hypothetical protein